MISNNDAKEILAKEYHIDNYEYLINDLLLPDYRKDKHPTEFDNDLFSSVTYLGESNDCEVSVFEVYLKAGCHNKRVAISQAMFRILRSQAINNALVAFVNEDKKNFRISLLTSKYEFDGNKIVKVLSNPRRFSYSLGYKTKTKTAYKFLISKGKVSSLDELISRFSVEVVNKEFYTEIATAFTELVGGNRNGKKYEKQLSIFGVEEHSKYAEFGVRLIGRIMFCWFLKEKRSTNGISLVPKDWLSRKTIESNDSYYHQTLEPLFFELLNTPHNRRKSEYLNEEADKVPYLNGGLFSPHDDDRYEYDPATFAGKKGNVEIPNEWFLNLYNVLNEYNFTVDENTAYDIELSIDPEMLGRIFENLLAEINPETGENAKKNTGSFYTPRDIVDYMVDSSICEYLKNKTNISEARINALITYGIEGDELAVFTDDEKERIFDALYTITVIDPACGSGAFPIGMLQKIVYIFERIDPEAKMWLEHQLKSADILLQKKIKSEFKEYSMDYIRKLTVIKNSIFGVDIQSIAVEISRLRCFLSLIIEEQIDDSKENRGINPLPNLDFKFITANSLKKLPDGTESEKYVFDDNQGSLFEDNKQIKNLKAVRENYFNSSIDERQQLQTEFYKIQKNMMQFVYQNHSKTEKYKALCTWEPFENGSTDWFDPEWMFGVKSGFDIVIGNPPYGVTYYKDDKNYLKGRFPCVPDYESADFFLDCAHAFMNKDSIVCYIIPNMFLINTNAKKFRTHLASIYGIKRIDNLSSFSVFEKASVRNAIVLFSFITKTEGILKDIQSLDDLKGESKTVNINFDILSENIDNWLNILLIDKPVKTIIDKIITGSKPLVDYCNISQGLIPYDKYRGHSPETIKNKIWNASYQKDETYQKELRGKDIKRYSLKWNGKDWLSYGEWLAAPRRKEFFTEERILIREITNPRILATFTEEEYYNTPSIINCIEFKANPLYLLGILNSKLFTFYHFSSSPKANKGLFPKILVADVRKMPIKIDTSLCPSMVELVKKILREYSTNLDAQIDRLVYKIYGLTNEEIELVESSIESYK